MTLRSSSWVFLLFSVVAWGSDFRPYRILQNIKSGGRVFVEAKDENAHRTFRIRYCTDNTEKSCKAFSKRGDTFTRDELQKIYSECREESFYAGIWQNFFGVVGGLSAALTAAGGGGPLTWVGCAGMVMGGAGAHSSTSQSLRGKADAMFEAFSDKSCTLAGARTAEQYRDDIGAILNGVCEEQYEERHQDSHQLTPAIAPGSPTYRGTQY